ncbi:uncharacterized protein DUF397 [Haloactinospora alba]|uniref:Uncharacterized protein DUF397 n=1 Tax=Haloactinospora alba TaxID=405555 RepID=A0A543N7F9_9ACTN|nr:DUF397 domain-containing protein [Haloactinospora alba]TQN27762.1 uncharacterized protein DUF397 [Haloactinospora alba]
MADRREWHKSSYSNGNNASCVEVAEEANAVGVRDSQNRELGHICFSPNAWATFLHGLKGSRF